MRFLPCFIAACALAFPATLAQAQAPAPASRSGALGTQPTPPADQSAGWQGVKMRNGKVVQYRAGKPTKLDRDLLLADGTKVMTDGTYRRPDGTPGRLQDGEYLAMDGTLTTKAARKQSKKGKQ